MPQGRRQKADSTPKNSNGATLDFEAQLFLAADKLRKNLGPSDYKHVAQGLIFLMHFSNAFGKPVCMPRDPLCQRDTPVSEHYTAGLAVHEHTRRPPTQRGRAWHPPG